MSVQLRWNGERVQAKLRAADEKSAREMGKALKKDTQEGIRKGPKTGREYRVTSKYHKAGKGGGQLNRHGKKLQTGGLSFKLRSNQKRLGMARLVGVHRASDEGEYPANRLGKLLNSIVYQVRRTSAGRWMATVYSRVRYAKWLQEGTKRMKPRLLIRDTLKKNDRKYREIAANIYRRAIR